MRVKGKKSPKRTAKAKFMKVKLVGMTIYYSVTPHGSYQIVYMMGPERC